MGDFTSSHFGSTAGGAAVGGVVAVSLMGIAGAGVGVLGNTTGAGDAATNPEGATGLVLPRVVGSIMGVEGMPLRTVSSKSGLFKVNSAMSV